MKILMLVCFIVCLFACQEPQKPKQAYQAVSGEAVKKDTPLTFPADHGAHLKQGIEWWYLTANLTDAQGKTFGVQWTLFRSLQPQKLNTPWWDDQVYFAHFALQDDLSHYAFEKFARAVQAGVKAMPFSAHIDDWQLKSTSTTFLPLTLKAKVDDFAVNLTLTDSPRVLHGIEGYSQKTHSGHASYYYSYPFLKVSGDLVFKGLTHQVTGKAWYDREWSASLIGSEQLGWDWFSIQFDESDAGLMLFCIRGDTNQYDYCSGSQLLPSGEVISLAQQDINLTPIQHTQLDGKSYPSKWLLMIKNQDEYLIETVTPDSRNQLTIPYWEGRIKVTGKISGKGYGELTGY